MATENVTKLIDAAKKYTDELVATSETALADAIGAVEWAREPSVPLVTIGLPDAPPSTIDAEVPTLADITLDLPAAPGASPQFQDISPVIIGTIPELRATIQSITLPDKPSQLNGFQQTPPSINLSASFPAAPSLIVPEVPTITPRTAPDKPLVRLPTFDGSMPTDLPTAPTDLPGTLNTAFHSATQEFVTVANSYVDAELVKLNPQYHAQMAKIESQLSTYLAGGTGLRPEVEDAIYSRGRAKNDVEAKRVQDAAFADMAARGFTLPNGALASTLARARQEAANNNNKTANEIIVMQAEMEQKNLQFAITTSTGLRTAMVSAAMAYMQNLSTLNGQALDYAKSVLNSIIEMYNTQVKVFMAKLDAYKTEAQVYETLMRGALAGIEVYKAEIQALQALTEVDMAQVNVYRARIDVLTAMSSMYKTQVEAVVSKASLERLRIDLFQAQVQAYGAQVQAKSAEWQGYAAAINGEEAKAKMFSAQVQAYGAEVQGFKAKIDAQAEAARATAMTNDARAKQYVAEVEGYKAVVSAQGDIARTKLESARQTVVAFQAKTQAQVAKAQVGMEYYKAVGNITVEQGRLFMQRGVADVEAKSKYIQLLSTLHTANATVHANLAGSAMAGMNSLASISATE